METVLCGAHQCTARTCKPHRRLPYLTGLRSCSNRYPVIHVKVLGDSTQRLHASRRPRFNIRRSLVPACWLWWQCHSLLPERGAANVSVNSTLAQTLALSSLNIFPLFLLSQRRSGSGRRNSPKWLLPMDRLKRGVTVYGSRRTGAPRLKLYEKFLIGQN